MYDMYPDQWAGTETRDRQSASGQRTDRPRRRVRRTHEARPAIIRLREERRSELSA